MKKILAALLVLALVAPAMAVGTITFGTPVTSVAGQVTIPWTATEGVVGISLKVNVTDGTASSVAVGSFFDVFIDSAYRLGTGYTIGAGKATALQTGPGDVNLPSAVFSISAAGLDDDGIGTGTEEAPLSGSIVIQGTAGKAVVISADTLRGGIVGYNGAMTVVTLPINTTFGAGVTDCVKSTAPFYADWVAFGKPDCWCFRRQCHGDADGLQVAATKTVPAHWVGTPDLTILTNGWKKQNSDPGFSAFICADFDQTAVAATKTVPAHRVGTPDLTILTNYWKKTDAQNPECPMTNFNSWKN